MSLSASRLQAARDRRVADDDRDPLHAVAQVARRRRGPRPIDSPVPAWPPSKTSCSDSLRRGKPPTPSSWRSVPNRSNRPVRSLCGIGLVAGVPDDPVARRLEQAMERDRQLDDAEATSRGGRPSSATVAMIVSRISAAELGELELGRGPGDRRGPGGSAGWTRCWGVTGVMAPGRRTCCGMVADRRDGFASRTGCARIARVECKPVRRRSRCFRGHRRADGATRGRRACVTIDHHRARSRPGVALPGAHAARPSRLRRASRATFNGTLDRRPAVIVPCAIDRRVVAAVRAARAAGLPIAVRGGGHSVAGHASPTAPGGLPAPDARGQVDPGRLGHGSAAGRSGTTSTRRPSPTGWRCPAARSGTRGSAA